MRIRVRAGTPVTSGQAASARKHASLDGWSCPRTRPRRQGRSLGPPWHQGETASRRRSPSGPLRAAIRYASSRNQGAGSKADWAERRSNKRTGIRRRGARAGRHGGSVRRATACAIPSRKPHAAADNTLSRRLVLAGQVVRKLLQRRMDSRTVKAFRVIVNDQLPVGRDVVNDARADRSWPIPHGRNRSSMPPSCCASGTGFSPRCRKICPSHRSIATWCKRIIFEPEIGDALHLAGRRANIL